MRFLDIETTGLNHLASNAAILMVGWLDDGHKPKVLHLASKYPDTWQDRLVLIPRDKAFVGHNAKFDSKWLKHFGVNLKIKADTMVISHLVNENRSLGLKSLMADRMGGDWTWQGEWNNSDPDEMAEYLIKDLYATKHLYESEEPKLTQAQRLLFNQIIIPALNHLVVTELHGVYLNKDDLAGAEETIKAKIDSLISDLALALPDSEVWPKGMEPKWGATNWQRWFLFEYLGITPKRVGKPNNHFPNGAPAMSDDILANIDHPVGSIVRDLAKAKKAYNGFITPYKEQVADNKIYTNFNLTGTVTGRLSSGSITTTKPRIGVNLQQVPKDKFIKPLFKAPPGYVFMEADYSQLELRVAAVLAKESTMLNLYQNSQDIHTWMASQLLGKTTNITELERRTAKAINFGFLYGMSAKTFKQVAKQQYNIDVTDVEAHEFREAYFRHFPKLKPWHNHQVEVAQRKGYVTTLFGRRRHLPNIQSSDFSLRATAKRQAINSPVQGTGSDIALRAYAEIGSHGKNYKCIGLIHDALLFYVKEGKELKTAKYIKRIMEKPVPNFNCPIVADVTWGTYWGDRSNEL